MKSNLLSSTTEAENTRPRSNVLYRASSFETRSRQAAGTHGHALRTVRTDAHLHTSPVPLGRPGANRIARFPGEALGRSTGQTTAPVFRQNREYNRALRQAELAAWEFGKPAAAKRSLGSLATLSAEQRESSGEKVLYALLTGLCGVAIGLALVDSTALLDHWDTFVRGVRTLLG
jgi:hypothetical protein